MPLWMELLTIVGGIIAALVILGIMVGFLGILPDWGKGLTIVLFAAAVIGALIYGAITPASPPYPTEDPYEQHYQDQGAPGGN